MPWGHKCEFLVTWDSTGVKSWIAGEGGGGMGNFGSDSH